MGKTLKRVLGGLATGAGNYLVTKATEDAKTAREERLFERQQALDALSHSREVDKIKIQGSIQEGLIGKTGEQTRLNYRTQGSEQRVTDANRGTIDRQATTLRGTIEGALLDKRGRHERALKKMELDAEAKKDPITDWKVDADTGQWVGFTAKGRRAFSGIKAGADPDVVAQASASGDAGTDPFRPGGGKQDKPAPSIVNNQIRIGDKSYWPQDGGWRDAQGQLYDVDASGNLVPRRK